MKGSRDRSGSLDSITSLVSQVSQDSIKSRIEENIGAIRDVYGRKVAKLNLAESYAKSRRKLKKKKKNRYESSPAPLTLPNLKLFTAASSIASPNKPEGDSVDAESLRSVSDQSYDASEFDELISLGASGSEDRDSPFTISSMENTTSRVAKLKPRSVLKPFKCRHKGCNKACSMAFDLVVHERTCKYLHNFGVKAFKPPLKIPPTLIQISRRGWKDRTTKFPALK